jgi:hypothetical protein
MLTCRINAVAGSEVYPDLVPPSVSRTSLRGPYILAHPNDTPHVEDIGRGDPSCSRRGHIKGGNYPVGERAIDDVGVALVYDPHGVGQSS